MAFTEQGVAMLSSVLKSERAIHVNIQVIRVYTGMRQLIVDNKDLWLKIEKIEQALKKKDEEVQTNNLKMIQFENLKKRSS
jgi:succinate dehydrogenase/fumarate reductase-like Fe-S protein